MIAVNREHYKEKQNIKQCQGIENDYKGNEEGAVSGRIVRKAFNAR